MSKEFETRLGRYLAALREDSGLSQESLAAQLGRDQAFVSRVEGGQRRVSADDLLAWLSALGTPLIVIAADLEKLWRSARGINFIWADTEQQSDE